MSFQFLVTPIEYPWVLAGIAIVFLVIEIVSLTIRGMGKTTPSGKIERYPFNHMIDVVPHVIFLGSAICYLMAAMYDSLDKASFARWAFSITFALVEVIVATTVVVCTILTILQAISVRKTPTRNRPAGQEEWLEDILVTVEQRLIAGVPVWTGPNHFVMVELTKQYGALRNVVAELRSIARHGFSQGEREAGDRQYAECLRLAKSVDRLLKKNADGETLEKMFLDTLISDVGELRAEVFGEKVV